MSCSAFVSSDEFSSLLYWVTAHITVTMWQDPCAVQPKHKYTLLASERDHPYIDSTNMLSDTFPIKYMYRQVHTASLPVNILHITCLSSCTQWLQEATPSTPLPLVTEYHCQWSRHACHAKVNVIQYTKVYQIVSAVRAGEAVWYT